MDNKKLDKATLEGLFSDYGCNRCSRIASMLSIYRTGEYVYPDVVKRNLKVNEQEAEDILDRLVEEGITQKCFQYTCPTCGRYVGPFRTEDTEDEVYCDSCDGLLNKAEKHYAYKIL